jgi:hypothetical protein
MRYIETYKVGIWRKGFFRRGLKFAMDDPEIFPRRTFRQTLSKFIAERGFERYFERDVSMAIIFQATVAMASKKKDPIHTYILSVSALLLFVLFSGFYYLRNEAVLRKKWKVVANVVVFVVWLVFLSICSESCREVIYNFVSSLIFGCLVFLTFYAFGRTFTEEM